MEVDVEIIPRSAGVLADEAFFVCFLDGALQDSGFVVELAADVDVGGGGVHGAADDETAFNELVRVFAHDLAVFAGAGLAFVGVDNEVPGFLIVLPAFEVHERLGNVSIVCLQVLDRMGVQI